MDDKAGTLSKLKAIIADKEKVDMSSIKVGDIIYVPLDEEDGLTLKKGYKDRLKYIVIIGFTPEGIAVGASMVNIEVEGANGGLHTNYEGKAQAAVDALTKDGYDFAYVHVEAPDEMGHQGSIENKVKSIENLDSKVIARIKSALDASGEPYRMLVCPDHPTPIRCRTHTSDPVPYIIYDSIRQRKSLAKYSEHEALATGVYEPNGYKLIERLLNK